jgi:hypothetical protein
MIDTDGKRSQSFQTNNHSYFLPCQKISDALYTTNRNIQEFTIPLVKSADNIIMKMVHKTSELKNTNDQSLMKFEPVKEVIH